MSHADRILFIFNFIFILSNPLFLFTNKANHKITNSHEIFREKPTAFDGV